MIDQTMSFTCWDGEQASKSTIGFCKSGGLMLWASARALWEPQMVGEFCTEKASHLVTALDSFLHCVLVTVVAWSLVSWLWFPDELVDSSGTRLFDICLD